MTADLHTKGRITVREDGEANQYAILSDDGHWLLTLLHNGQQVTQRQRANMHRIVACWNACDGIDSQTLLRRADDIQTGRSEAAETRQQTLVENLMCAAAATVSGFMDLNLSETSRTHGGTKLRIPELSAAVKAMGAAESPGDLVSHTATAILGIRTGSVVRDHLLRFAAHDMERLSRQRDTLRDALYTALPFVEDMEGDSAYKPGAVAKALRKIRDALEDHPDDQPCPDDQP